MSECLPTFPRCRALPASLVLAAALAWPAGAARADAVTDWNQRSADFIAESRLGTPPAVRVMALVQAATHGAVHAIVPQGPAPEYATDPAPGASLEAAVAAAHRAVFTRLLPSQQVAVDAAYRAALAAVPDGPARSAGVAAGEQAAARVLALRAGDTLAAESHRPHAVPGTWVPTAPPAAVQWPQRQPWLMSSASQFRPPPPPALDSEAWIRDYNEVRAFGGKTSLRRSAEQTDVARFWEYSLPAIYHGVVRSVALQPGRSVADNARLFAAATLAMDDALIAVFDAKYHYHFWRPVTAIRNGDIDGHDATEREAGWTPLIDVPGHPEYPSAHSILAAAVGEVIRAEVGARPMPTLSTRSPTAKGATRQWRTVDAFVHEVGDARVWEGVHFRTAVEVGAAMGRRIGERAAGRLLAPAP